ncbi:MAG: hypothetical protein SAK29_26945 [Scytonema sp. PMC 1069.18]|nr:hypothetical protein [Scytonema sp. PMC 1069.18]MEC4884712.1 hypothetical protein [Scytonema sp. PMC 1070.18]
MKNSVIDFNCIYCNSPLSRVIALVSKITGEKHPSESKLTIRAERSQRRIKTRPMTPEQTITWIEKVEELEGNAFFAGREVTDEETGSV